MSDNRIGRQTPTTAVILPYAETKGMEAIDIYNKTEKTAMEWQGLLLSDMMAVNEDGLWVHTKFGYSVPRRNGKSECIIMRELWGFTYGEKILHTAHRTTTSHASWERIVDILTKAGYVEGEDFKTHKQYGLEDIVWCDKERPGKINFRTRSSKGGLGEGYDLLIVDEAQEYTDDQESALKYVVTDSMNPQTVFCGTPPTLASSGTVFTKYRKKVLQGETMNSAWAEWAVNVQSDVKNKDLWYECNPSLGTVFTERSVADEIGNDDVDFNIQRLGLWLSYNQKSAISKAEWQRLEVDVFPEIEKSTLTAGIKFGYDGANVALSVGVKSADRVFVEAIDCQSTRNGLDWIVSWLKEVKPTSVIIDGASGQAALAEKLDEEKIKYQLPTVKEVILANSKFELAIFNESVIHMEQPSLEQSVSNCEKRPIGSGGGFGYRSLKENIEVALLDSVILAHWGCSIAKEKKPQRVMY